MNSLILAGATVLILLALLIFVVKIQVAYSHCSGGAPLLDGVIFSPISLGVGAAVFFHHYRIAASGLTVGLMAFVVMVVAYIIAWKFGTKRDRQRRASNRTDGLKP